LLIAYYFPLCREVFFRLLLTTATPKSGLLKIFRKRLKKRTFGAFSSPAFFINPPNIALHAQK